MKVKEAYNQDESFDFLAQKVSTLSDSVCLLGQDDREVSSAKRRRERSDQKTQCLGVWL